MSAHVWSLLLWGVVLGAALRIVYAIAWRIPAREQAVTRHPAGRHRKEQR